MRIRNVIILIAISAGLFLAVPVGGRSDGVTNQQPVGMVIVPAGQYRPLFRSPSDPETLPVKSFFMDVLPVTNGEFLEFLRANPKWRRSTVKRLFADPGYLSHWAQDLVPGTNAPLNAAVTRVSWFAAKAFADWKQKRLPTTAEWEYAAEASNTRSDGLRDKGYQLQIALWYSTPSEGTPSPVGQKSANFYGLRDLHGVNWEWVSDFNTAMVTGDAREDSGLNRQLFCGSGALGSQTPENFPAFMRYGFRSSLKASYTVHNLGFRCAKDL